MLCINVNLHSLYLESSSYHYVLFNGSQSPIWARWNVRESDCIITRFKRCHFHLGSWSVFLRCIWSFGMVPLHGIFTLMYFHFSSTSELRENLQHSFWEVDVSSWRSEHPTHISLFVQWKLKFHSKDPTGGCKHELPFVVLKRRQQVPTHFLQYPDRLVLSKPCELSINLLRFPHENCTGWSIAEMVIPKLHSMWPSWPPSGVDRGSSQNDGCWFLLHCQSLHINPSLTFSLSKAQSQMLHFGDHCEFYLDCSSLPSKCGHFEPNIM